MHAVRYVSALLTVSALVGTRSDASAQEPHQHGEMPRDTAMAMDGAMAHEMFMLPLGGGWTLLGMAQVHPVLTAGLGDDAPLDETGFYLTQPAAMINIESPAARFVLRTTLNMEGLTLDDGELTFGGWGEGFIDRRHPHTLVHEAMLSFNWWDVAGSAMSISAGKGFAPYGTDDPMSRPALKYPTNHHLSQILERWTLNGVYVKDGWGIEAGVFGGAEPEGPYDLGNIESFGNSWSARLSRRFGDGAPTMAPLELSVSLAGVLESHGTEEERTSLFNVAVRHASAYGFGDLYALGEASMSDPEHGDGYFSLLAEAAAEFGAHRPYYRLEYATRPEYEREGPPGTDAFFRYDHDAEAIGATRWLISSIGYGYGYELTGYPLSARPFVELKHSRVRAERAGIVPETLFGDDDFWTLTAGFRIYLGGGPMRMGGYGVLDAMTQMGRMMEAMTLAPDGMGDIHLHEGQ